jgi:hypothetical protein
VSGPTEPGSAEATSDREPPDPGERIRRSEAKATTAVVDVTSAREAEDRSWIAKAILVVFVISIVMLLAILWTEGAMTAKWDQVALQAVDLIKTSVLPVVTLVLGYYFGSRSGKG